MNKLIALIDCDSFFVSCEQVADPSLKGLPVVVTTGERGCIVSRSKEAKALGVKMGAPVFMDRKEHSGIIYIRARHSFYSAVSKRVMETVKKFSPVVEVSSIDEAYIDLTGTERLYKATPEEIARRMLKTLAKQLKELGTEIEFTPEAISAIADAGFDKVYGARPLRRAIQTKIEDRLSELILENKLGEKCTVDFKDGEFTFE